VRVDATSMSTILTVASVTHTAKDMVIAATITFLHGKQCLASHVFTSYVLASLHN